jgi:hypothetical protein
MVYNYNTHAQRIPTVSANIRKQHDFVEITDQFFPATKPHVAKTFYQFVNYYNPQPGNHAHKGAALMSAPNTRDLFMQGDDSPAKNTPAGNKTRIIKSAFASLQKTEHRTAACSPTSSILVPFLPAFAHACVCVVNFRSAGALNVCVCGLIHAALVAVCRQSLLVLFSSLSYSI